MLVAYSIPTHIAIRLSGCSPSHSGIRSRGENATSADEAHDWMLRELEAGVDAVHLDGQNVSVKLKVFDPLLVPLAKRSMLLASQVLPTFAERRIPLPITLPSIRWRRVRKPTPRSVATARRPRPLARPRRTASVRTAGVNICLRSGTGDPLLQGKSSPLFRSRSMVAPT